MIPTDHRGMLLAGAAALLGATLGGVLSACAPGPAEPPAPGPQLQTVPQLDDGQGGGPAETFCLAPADSSGLRAFVSRDGHNRRIYSIVDVHALPATSPYRCP